MTGAGVPPDPGDRHPDGMTRRNMRGGICAEDGPDQMPTRWWPRFTTRTMAPWRGSQHSWWVTAWPRKNWSRMRSPRCTGYGASCETKREPWITYAGQPGALPCRTLAGTARPDRSRAGAARHAGDASPGHAVRSSRPPTRGARPEVLRGLARSPDRRRDGNNRKGAERPHPAGPVRPRGRPARAWVMLHHCYDCRMQTLVSANKVSGTARVYRPDTDAADGW